MTSIQQKFAVYVWVPVLIGLSALCVLGYRTARDHLLNQMAVSGEYHLQSVAEGISGSVFATQTALRVLALVEASAGRSDAARRASFRRVLDTASPSLATVFMSLPDGRVIRERRSRFFGGSASLAPVVADDVRRLPQDRIEGITPPHRDTVSSQLLISIYRKMATETGQPLGIIGIDIDVTRVSEEIWSEGIFTEKGGMALVRPDGVALVHSDPSRIGKRIGDPNQPLDREVLDAIQDPAVGFRQEIGKRLGQTWYVGFQRVPKTDLTVVLLEPAEAVIGPLRRLTTEMLLVAVPLIALLAVLLTVMNRKISRPIMALRDSALAITETHAYQEPLPVTTRDEIGQLTRAFNDMMTGLRQRDFIRDTFGRYVTMEVVQELLETPEGLELGGETREVTIVFSDLRGFTPLAEQLPADAVVGLLNRYLGRMTDIITRHKGTINEFIGDGILTIFDAPVRRGDGPGRAVACAIEMQQAMDGINAENRQLGVPALTMGIGIHTGRVIVGNIGCDQRAKYGVIGHHVNLASRVESATVGGQVLISAATHERVADRVAVRSTQSLSLKGVGEAVLLFDIAGIDDLRLPEETRAAHRLEPPASVTVVFLRDKQATGAAIAGRMTHLSTEWTRLELSEEPTDGRQARIELASTGGPPTCLYGKIVDSHAQGGQWALLLRNSYFPPEARRILEGSASIDEL